MKKQLIALAGAVMMALMWSMSIILSMSNAHAAYDRHGGGQYECNIIRNDAYVAEKQGFYKLAFDFRREHWRYCRNRKD